MIVIRGARQHNLADLDLDLDPRGFIVLCGRSGSGKSSLAFDTLHAEGWRRYVEAMTARARAALPQLPRPDVDRVDGLPPTIALSQLAWLPPGRPTVGSWTELDLTLQILFGRAGTWHDPVSGEPIRPTTHDGIVATLLALPVDSRVTIEAPVRRHGAEPVDRQAVLAEVARAGFSRVRVDGALRTLDELRPTDLPADAALRVVVDRIKVSSERQDRLYDAVRTATNAGQGQVVVVTDNATLTFVDRPWSVGLDRVLPDLRPALFRAGTGAADPCPTCRGKGEVDGAPCAACDGGGLGLAARHVRLGDDTWRDVQTGTLAALAARLDAWPDTPVTAPLKAELRRRVGALTALGLGDLRVDRRLATLSAGELQRVRLARQVGAELSGVLYVLDEPTAGLDEDQARAVVGVLRALRAQGNGLVVVEHHPAVIAAADRVIELGPGPGPQGGRILYDGPPAGLAGQDTPTGRALRAAHAVPSAARAARGCFHAGDRTWSVGVLTAVTGPSASGKSRALAALADAVRAGLDEGAAGPFDRLVRVDEEEAGRSRRSMPATYTGLWDTVRELLAATQEARVRGLDAAAFSLNVKGGRCEACKGLGVTQVELGFLPDVVVPCEACEGRRFARDVLEVRYKGLDAGKLLELTADEAAPLLSGHPRMDEALRALREVGLGYLPLGQPTDTLSGGELQRLKLARELVRAMRSGADRTLFVLDEPAAGLHPEDQVVLAHLLQRLVAAGGTVIVATHAPLLWGAADVLVPLG